MVTVGARVPLRSARATTVCRRCEEMRLPGVVQATSASPFLHARARGRLCALLAAPLFLLNWLKFFFNRISTTGPMNHLKKWIAH